LKQKNTDGAGIERDLHDPFEDKLIPLEPLDLNNIRTVDDLVRAMAKTAFTGRQLGEAADVLEAMARDQDCFVGHDPRWRHDRGQAGADCCGVDRPWNCQRHCFYRRTHGPRPGRGHGRSHFRYNPEVSDEQLYEQGYNRVYDTLEPEQNLDDVEKVMAQVLQDWDPNEVMCSYKLNHAIGAFLAKRPKDQRGILRSAFEQGVPVFVPAFTDSELGLGCGAEQSVARVFRAAQIPLRSLRGSGTLCRDATSPGTPGDFHHRRRRAA
jgi:deoxyhypusine synthase